MLKIDLFWEHATYQLKKPIIKLKILRMSLVFSKYQVFIHVRMTLLLTNTGPQTVTIYIISFSAPRLMTFVHK